MSMSLVCCVLFLAGSAVADKWAVLVTGSRGWDNYRHHADVAHAYQRLISGGVPRNHIIVMQYADVAGDTQHFNPYVGQLFNKATGQDPGIDVKKGLTPDYIGSSVTTDAVLGVLTGSSSMNGPVLGSGPDDDVTLVWAGHGGAGMLYMPDNQASNGLYADQLLDAIKTMHSQSKYGRLLILMEACESGSMFSSSDLESLNVLALTAAAADENSYTEYCCSYFRPPSCTVGGQDIGVCLADLFSVGWLEFADAMKSSSTVADLADAATARAASMSHVQVMGQLSFQQLPASQFLGASSASSNRSFLPQKGPSSSALPIPPADFDGQEEEWQQIKALLDANSTGAVQRLPMSRSEFACYRTANLLVDQRCGGYRPPHGAKFSRIVAEACAAGRGSDVMNALEAVCSDAVV